MAYYLSKERDYDVAAAYRRYQAYLHENEQRFPPNAFKLGTAMWYQNANDHRCPHDGWLESLTVCEFPDPAKEGQRITSISTRLLGAYHDGHIEFVYPRVFRYALHSPASRRGLGDWLYDEFTLSPSGHVLHEIEWCGSPSNPEALWIIEASDVEFKWIPKSSI